MPDHINIKEPGYSDFWNNRLRILKLEAEIKNLEAERDKYRSDLEAIFTRIGRGDEVWLYPEGGGGRIEIIRKPEATILPQTEKGS